MRTIESNRDLIRLLEERIDILEDHGEYLKDWGEKLEMMIHDLEWQYRRDWTGTYTDTIGFRIEQMLQSHEQMLRTVDGDLTAILTNIDSHEQRLELAETNIDTLRVLVTSKSKWPPEDAH